MPLPARSASTTRGARCSAYLPGETIGGREPWPGWASADSMLVQVGQWLRRVHDLTAGFVPPQDECWFIGRTMGPGLIVGHQDASPYNAVVDGDRLVGFCDWDTAGPSSRDWDLAFSALTWVPLASPRDGMPVERATTYASGPAAGICCSTRTATRATEAGSRAAVPQRARRQAGVIRHMADAGDAASTALLPIAALLERSATDVEALPAAFWTR